MRKKRESQEEKELRSIIVDVKEKSQYGQILHGLKRLWVERLLFTVRDRKMVVYKREGRKIFTFV